jgi:hypothetical protein
VAHTAAGVGWLTDGRWRGVFIIEDGGGDKVCTTLQYRARDLDGDWGRWKIMAVACKGEEIGKMTFGRRDASDLQFRLKVPGEGTGAQVQCTRLSDPDSDACS